MLSIHDVTLGRGSRLLLTGLSVALDAGGILHVIAPNGVGKSSLLRAVAGLLPPRGGMIQLTAPGGENVEAADIAALLDEQPGLKPVESVRANLDILTRITTGAAPSPDRLADIAHMLGLTDLLDLPVRYLSTGQRRRSMLARLLLVDRPLWLLDEPYAGLDTDGQALLDRLIADHRATGGAVLITHHGTVSGAVPFDLSPFVAVNPLPATDMEDSW